MEEPLVLSIYMKDPSKIRGVGDKMYPWDLVSLELREDQKLANRKPWNWIYILQDTTI